MRMLRRYELLLIAGFSVLVATMYGCSNPAPSPAAEPQATSTPAPPSTEQVIQRGKYLVDTSGCHDCHSPKKYGPRGPEPDPTRILSGHREDVKVTAPYVPAAGSPWTYATQDDFTAWSGPWGISFAANLTPDTNTGLRSGVWTEELFIKAIRTGKHMGTSRDILPPMPWHAYAQFSDDDLKAIWAYLGTIPAITNHVPDAIPPKGATATQ